MKSTRLFVYFAVLATAPGALWARKEKAVQGNQQQAQVLIVGLDKNVKSNYYYDDLIAEQTGIQADSIDHRYNAIIAANIIAAGSNGSCRFTFANLEPAVHCERIVGKIHVAGEAEQCVASLNDVTTEELRATLDEAHADYLLVLNQHYLKWQEEPMRTVFHMISYTLFDKNKKQVTSGNQYFTSMNLEAPDKVAQLSRKTSSKIAAAIARSLD
ncbi:hypothetical protein [Taibaiella chishuiensis]|uniref:Uncharacterized protein n=1 Tax=Taibaiella chishuiensis TaxID=1434707 RepID=A0A2P8D7U8_9BACT|nr:hypothetical protein [Taibaiella chishuiensis]PSK93282.1 hypothetical protein B0I18_102252 [Taibaiella chishuiensis]